jgi:hypothetical protein
VAGWYGHIEVPENEHWDPGAFQWTGMLTRAKAIAGPASQPSTGPPAPDKAPNPLPPWYWPWLNWLLGEGDFKQFGPKSAPNRPAEAPEKIPSWAWVKAGQFTTARKGPH